MCGAYMWLCSSLQSRMLSRSHTVLCTGTQEHYIGFSRSSLAPGEAHMVRNLLLYTVATKMSTTESNLFSEIQSGNTTVLPDSVMQHLYCCQILKLWLSFGSSFLNMLEA